jgi:hypothetical protein
LIEEVRLDELDAVTNRLEVRILPGIRPYETRDRVAALEEQLREVRPVLAADSGDEGAAHEPIVPAASA